MTDPFERAARAERDRRDRRLQLTLRASLRVHAAVFPFVQLLLIAIWALTGAGFPWFVFPLLGWAALLAGHAVAVRESIRILGSDRPAEEAV
jgi:hypothetical protein